ncbi:histidine phosphatase family protein [Sinisalibacter aestuarii]|uniref:Phosphoglycerate mutase n=1 Tax=Sinisalibacter aestuarii TaxID=2949426 RepID=A0ABQ5LTD3_9RHOB|nr:histidine phosphatase family protein [Sinisalibacter aestuarii]GKY87873.1 phosphoglycerate mutase [Sinisalibacter aestuarii]
MCNELYLLRHGQSEWNAARRHQGQLESRLTELGRSQAAAMGAVLAREIAEPARFTAFTSPLLRASETAAIALAPLGLTATADDRLKEVHFGAWQGLTDAEIFARYPWAEAPREADPFMWNFMAPGGETLPLLSARLGAFLDGLAGPAVIVAHGVALRVLRGLCLGLDSSGMRDLPGGQGVVWRLRDGAHSVLA